MGFQLVPGTYVARNLICEDIYIVYNVVSGERYDIRHGASLIYVFQCQVEWRTFRPAQKLLKQKNKFLFPVLQLLLPYIEMYEQMREGRSSEGLSRVFFKSGFNEIFKNINNAKNFDVSNTVYDELRCGLAHNNMAYRILVTYDGNRNTEAISFDDQDNILINPKSFYRVTHEHFKNYCSDLKNAASGEGNAEPYDNFKKMFESLIGFIDHAGNQFRPKQRRHLQR